MTRFLILDTETTALLDAGGVAIEVAAILYSVEQQCILQQFSSILTIPEPIENPAQGINHISVEVIREMYSVSDSVTRAPNDGWVYGVVRVMNENADIAIACNAAFDREILGRLGWHDIVSGPWLCIQEDFSFERMKGRRDSQRLEMIALAHDVPVVWTHRALDDCRLIAEIFNEQDDLKALVAQAMAPKSIYVSHLPFEKNDLNKANGFIWDRIISRKWARKMTDAQAAEIPFPINKVQSLF